MILSSYAGTSQEKKKTFQFLYFALCLQFSCSLICKIWPNALRMMSPNRSPSSSQSFCKNNFCFGLIYGSCWIAGLVYQLCCQLLIKVNFMKGMFFFLATGLTLHSINEILSFTNRTSIQSFSHWALNIGRAEIWKMNWWFLSFIMNELLSQCNLSTRPNCGSRCSRLALLQCLEQEEGQSKVGWLLPHVETPVSEVETTPCPAEQRCALSSSSSRIKMAEPHQERNGEENWVVLLNIMTNECHNTKELVTA